MSFQLKTYRNIFLTLCFVIFAKNSFALEIFYDAQLDYYIREFSSKLLKASKLKNVNVYLANSSDVNAFATEKKDIIFYSGLIWKMDNRNQFQGVLAHELAHLVSNHHLKTKMENEGVSAGTVASVIAGVGAAMAGAPQVGMAALLGGSAADVSKKLAYSRQHENEADTVGLDLLKKSNLNTDGFADFFAILERQERFYSQDIPEFLSTHPSTAKRKSMIQQRRVNNIKSNSYDEKFEIFKTKLFALTEDVDKVRKTLSYKPDSISKSLGLSILYLREFDFEKSLSYLDKAKSQGLESSWYFETKGQIFYQKGYIQESIIYYKKAKQELKSKSWIIDFQIAESYFALKDDKALDYYFKVKKDFPAFKYTLKRIGDFYSLKNDLVMAHSYFTIFYLEVNNKELASKHFNLLEQYIKKQNIKDKNITRMLEDLKHSVEK